MRFRNVTERIVPVIRFECTPVDAASSRTQRAVRLRVGVEVAPIECLLAVRASDLQLVDERANAVVDVHLKRSLAAKGTRAQTGRLAFAQELLALDAMHRTLDQLEAHFALELLHWQTRGLLSYTSIFSIVIQKYSILNNL